VNGIGQHVVEYVRAYMVYEMTVLDPSVVPVGPISPQPARDAGVALVVGLAVGVLLALTRELIQAPIENFMRQRKFDTVSLAMNRNPFEQKLAEAAFASTNDFTFCLVRLEGLGEYINILPQSSLQTVLRHVTQTMRNQLRGNDLIGRWSELDFAVLLFETPGDASVNTMGRVRTALSVPIKFEVSGEDLYLNPQIGIAEYRVGDTVDSMIKNVKWALDVAEKNNNGMYLLRATQPI
jgi:diguanylate cyclase (GGDEF)-like protein